MAIVTKWRFGHFLPSVGSIYFHRSPNTVVRKITELLQKSHGKKGASMSQGMRQRSAVTNSCRGLQRGPYGAVGQHVRCSLSWRRGAMRGSPPPWANVFWCCCCCCCCCSILWTIRKHRLHEASSSAPLCIRSPRSAHPPLPCNVPSQCYRSFGSHWARRAAAALEKRGS